MQLETLKTDIISVDIGPYHYALPAAMRLTLGLDGEVIVRARAQSGFLHRGIERTMQEHFWESAIAYSDHLEPSASAFGELAFCMAVEQIAGIEVPRRAKQIRIVLSEMSRIVSHFSYVAALARAVESETMVHYVLRDRERYLDLFELLTGARFSLNFLRFGGVAFDISEGFIERVIEVCEITRMRPKEYNDLFTFNQTLIRRTSNQAVLDAGTVKRFGLSGPNARASGVSVDVRKDNPYCGYEDLDFEAALGKGEFGKLGDAHDRYLIRLREISQGMDLIRQALESLESGEYWNRALPSGAKVPEGEAYMRVESPRGILGCHVVSDGGASPFRVQFVTPSSACFRVVDTLLLGANISDLPVFLASLDLSMSEVDK